MYNPLNPAPDFIPDESGQAGFKAMCLLLYVLGSKRHLMTSDTPDFRALLGIYFSPEATNMLTLTDWLPLSD